MSLPRISPRLAVWVALFAAQAHAQIYVFPRRAEQSHVIYQNFTWQQIDVLVGAKADKEEAPPVHSPTVPVRPSSSKPASTDNEAPATAPPAPSHGPPAQSTGHARHLGERTGGVRLYFYERERVIAEQAASSITDSYRRLVEQFQYVPTQTFPYILYNSYQEFLQTNLFPLQEGVLGVTSPENLKLTLPYMGDHQLFKEVSTHELAHQFTIQKLRTLSQNHGTMGSPLAMLPLWFIEGLAEYYAHEGVTPDAEMLVRDLLINPDLGMGYAMLDFFEDRPYSVLWTYKAGNVRCAFLEDTYGEGFLQRVLDNSVKLVAPSSPAATADPSYGFSGLLKQLTGDDVHTISQKFEVWLKRRAYRTYLDTAQDAPQLKRLAEPTSLNGLVMTFAAAPNGEVLLYRSISMETGDSRLLLIHHRRPLEPLLITVDGVPGVESLHPIEGRNFDVSQDRLVFVAGSNGRDLLYVQGYQGGQPGPEGTASRLRTTVRQTIDLRPHGIVGAFSPAFSPDGRRIAFIGMNEFGVRDVYVLPVDQPKQVKKLTDDAYSERQLSWGGRGVVYTSDATSHRHYNLFVVDPDRPQQPQRLTTRARDERDPLAMADGRIFFIAYERARANLYELVDEKVVRRTDIATGVFDPQTGPNGSLCVLFHRGGMRRPVAIPPEELLSTEAESQPPAERPQPLSRLSLDTAGAYQPYATSNWELGPVFGVLGGGSGGVVGQFVGSAKDRLGNHAVVLNVGLYGSFDLMDGYLLYVNQERRLTYGGGFFQSLRFREDKTFNDLPFRFSSGERFFGAVGSVRYPFDRFVYIQGDLALGGVNYFLLEAEELLLQFPEFNQTDQNLLEPWRVANDGVRLQTEGTIRLGFDTIRYHYATGPIAGTSALVEGTIAYQPFAQETFGNVRLDLERYFSLGGRSNFLLRGGSGITAGSRLAREYFLSSFDTLRGVRFGDESRLLGRNYFYSTAELQFPLNMLIRVFILTDLEGVVAMDFGGVGTDYANAFDKRVLNGVLGLNLGLGPFMFRLHFAKNFGVGSPFGLPVPPDEWVTNFSIGIAGLGGPFFDRTPHGQAHRNIYR